MKNYVKIALIVGLPTVVVGGYFGYLAIRKGVDKARARKEDNMIAKWKEEADKQGIKFDEEKVREHLKGFDRGTINWMYKLTEHTIGKTKEELEAVKDKTEELMKAGTDRFIEKIKGNAEFYKQVGTILIEKPK